MYGDFPGGRVAETALPVCSLPDWGTRFHMPKLRPGTAK